MSSKNSDKDEREGKCADVGDGEVETAGHLDTLGGADFEFVEFGADELRQLDEHLISGAADQGTSHGRYMRTGLRAKVRGRTTSDLLLAAVNFADEDGLGAFWEEICQVERSAPLAPGQYAKLAATEVEVLPVIQRDMPRTFPSHPVFSGEGGARGQAALQRILTAYAHYDPDVSYVQGINFVVAVLYIHLGRDEMRTFRLLRRLMTSPKHALRRLYAPGLPLLRTALTRLEVLLEHHLPELHRHFHSIGLHAVLYAQEWFLTLFTYSLPMSLAARVMSTFFADGWPALFRMALAVLKDKQDELMGCDLEHALTILKGFQRGRDICTVDADWVLVTRDDLVHKALKFDIDEDTLVAVDAHTQVNGTGDRSDGRGVAGGAAAGTAATGAKAR
mmetsp:Transcript_15022/g.47910  ORF Transcript_15022/g.47910 Transcript_15022/m.47910 type:complete len:391 (-) Transcript_15022:15-1187(-)